MSIGFIHIIALRILQLIYKKKNYNVYKGIWERNGKRVLFYIVNGFYNNVITGQVMVYATTYYLLYISSHFSLVRQVKLLSYSYLQTFIMEKYVHTKVVCNLLLFDHNITIWGFNWFLFQSLSSIDLNLT